MGKSPPEKNLGYKKSLGRNHHHCSTIGNNLGPLVRDPQVRVGDHMFTRDSIFSLETPNFLL